MCAWSHGSQRQNSWIEGQNTYQVCSRSDGIASLGNTFRSWRQTPISEIMMMVIPMVMTMMMLMMAVMNDADGDDRGG